MSKKQSTVAAFAAITIALLIGSVTLRAQPREPARNGDSAIFMRAKLASSKQVLEGLVTDDFALIRSGAEDMKKMSEHAEWPRARDEVYEHFSEEFRRQCGQLASLAEKRNREGVHFTYLSITSSCVNCHNYVRGGFRVVRDKTNQKYPVQLIPHEWEEPAQSR